MSPIARPPFLCAFDRGDLAWPLWRPQSQRPAAGGGHAGRSHSGSVCRFCIV